MLLNDEWRRLLQEYRAYHDDPVCEATHLVGIPLIVAALPAMVVPAVGGGMFVAGWVLQFVGHHYQGNPPKFFGDRRNLLVGLLWWFDTVLRPFGLADALFGAA